MAAILNVYAGSLIFVKLKKNVFLKSGKYFYTFNHFYSEKSSKKIAQVYFYDPQSAGINVQSPQSESTLRRLTLHKSQK